MSNEDSTHSTERVKRPRPDFTYRIVVSVPMAALGIIDSLCCIATLGWYSPGWDLKYGMRASLWLHHRAIRDAESTNGDKA